MTEKSIEGRPNKDQLKNLIMIYYNRADSISKSALYDMGRILYRISIMYIHIYRF